MMDLDEAIQHCKEQVQEQAKKGCYSCAEEHQQLAEWLKELKAYRETWRKLGMWLADTRLAIAPDETLDDVDEKLVRVAQVDMIDTVLEWMDEHEVEAKQNCTDCIIDGTDACSRGAGRAVDDEICGDFIPSRSEIPNTCGDAISRQAVLDVTWEEPSYTDALNVLTEVRDKVKVLPSVTPQQKTLSCSEKPNKWMSEARRWKRRYLDLKYRYLVLEQQARWIPVSERVPEKRGVYLVTQKAIFPGHILRRIVGYALNLHDVDEYDFKGKKRPGWYEYDIEWGYRELEDITAWMPLPEPYKAESEDKE